MKKILTFFILFIFCFNINNWISNSYVEENNKFEYLEIINYTNNKLQKTSNWRKYLNIINKFIEKNSKNEDILLKLNARINDILNNSNITNTETIYIMNYFKAKINYALIKILEKNKENIFFEDISSNDKKIVEEKLIELQLNLFEKWSNYLKNLLENFEELPNYQDNWNFNMNLDIDHELIWKINSNLSISDYIISISNFDSQIKWKIKWLIDASIKWKEEFKIELSTFLDFITKDSNMYLLLENLNITDDNSNEEIQEFVDIIKEFAEQNKYIKIEDYESQQIMGLLNSLNINKIISDWKDILSKPMFEAYKKDGEKYLIKPTKYACDKMKELSNKFDPFYGSSTCSQWQYENMLKDLAEIWYLYIIPWEKENEIGFYWIDYDKTKINSFIIYDENNIKELFINIIPEQEKYPNEWLQLDFKNNKYLNFNFNSEEINFIINSKLDTNNKFTYIDLNWNIKDSNATLLLKNNKITWLYEMYNKSYDWNTGKYEKTEKLTINIDWTTDNNNKLSTLYWEVHNKKLIDNSKTLEWSMKYDNGDFSISFNTNNQYQKVNFELWWKWDFKEKILENWKLSISLEIIDYYSENQDYELYFKSDILLNNNIISGKTYIKDLINITHSWKYEKDYLIWNNYYKLNENSQYINNLWNIDWNLNISLDTRNNKQNTDILFDLYLNENKSINFSVNNEAIRSYKDINIIKPTNTIDSSELKN